MKTFAVIPINILAEAKTRLRAALPDIDRQALVLWMAGRVLDAVQRSGAVAEVAVVSPDAKVLRWAESRAAIPLAQSGRGLNDGLELGRAWAFEQRADALLVLLADLPCITSGEVRQLVHSAESSGSRSSVVIAPDRTGSGTNGLLMRPPVLMPFAFGPKSQQRHVQLAREAGVEPVLLHMPGTCFDVDTAADLDELRARDARPFATCDAALPSGERV